MAVAMVPRMGVVDGMLWSTYPSTFRLSALTTKWCSVCLHGKNMTCMARVCPGATAWMSVCTYVTLCESECVYISV